MWFRLLIISWAIISMAGCSVLFIRPKSTSTEERDAMFPTKGLQTTQPVTIYWNQNRIPFIHARTDEDLAYTMGLVHAHLRLTQLEIYRRASQGRLAEMAGPLAVKIDKSIRILNFGLAADEILASMPPQTITWVERYLNGINDYISRMKDYPPDLKFLGIRPEPWTLRDLAILWRLVSADVNWFQFFNFLRLQSSPDWEDLWERVIEKGLQSTPSFTLTDLWHKPGLLPWQFTKSGSNSLVISPDRSSNGAALMANDPHLGFSIPNFWLLIGFKSPSYHAVGMTIPGLPLIALGRNQDITWGGTNMRALSSHLYKLTEDDLKETQVEEQIIRVRGWFDTSVKIRQSKWGPIISDSPLFKSRHPVALRWVGHEVSDEITSFLQANRAKNWEEFRSSFKNYGVSAQNLLFADREGNIGHLLAYRQPIRRHNQEKKLFSSRDNTWVSYKYPLDLPFALNPEEGFIASTNNQPLFTNHMIGWLFPPNDRIDRLHELVSSRDKIRREDLEAWQEDVYSISAHNLARLITEKAERPEIVERGPVHGLLLDTLTSWDGQYDANSRGPVAFELIYYALARNHFSRIYSDENLVQALINEGHSRQILHDDISRMDRDVYNQLLVQALEEVIDSFQEFKNWGDMHTLRLAHLLANVPIVGKNWIFEKYPVSGGNETLFKSSSGSGLEARHSYYGSCSRHISDLSDMDENYFILLGGQDGWMTSPQTLDQVPLWKAGQYIRFPLRLTSIQKEFEKVVTLYPGK